MSVFGGIYDIFHLRDIKAISHLETPNVSSEIDNHLINKSIYNQYLIMKRKGATEQELRAYSLEMDKRAELQIE